MMNSRILGQDPQTVGSLHRKDHQEVNISQKKKFCCREIRIMISFFIFKDFLCNTLFWNCRWNKTNYILNNSPETFNYTLSVRFEDHTKDVMSVAFSADNRQIVSGSRDKTIKLWNTLAQCKYTIQVRLVVPFSWPENPRPIKSTKVTWFHFLIVNRHIDQLN